MLKDIWALVTAGVTPDQMQAVMRVGWRALIAFHMAYACGFLPMVGLPLQGFAMESKLEKIEDATVLQARLGIVREIRLTTAAMCETTDPRAREALQNTIDRLREDYRTITKAEFPQPMCIYK